MFVNFEGFFFFFLNVCVVGLVTVRKNRHMRYEREKKNKQAWMKVENQRFVIFVLTRRASKYV